MQSHSLTVKNSSIQNMHLHFSTDRIKSVFCSFSYFPLSGTKNYKVIGQYYNSNNSFIKISNVPIHLKWRNKISLYSNLSLAYYIIFD